MTERLPDWEARLGRFIAENRQRPFAWGAWDCILYACSAVEAMTGGDPAEEFRGRYHDKDGAAAILREVGKGTLLKTVDSKFPRRKPGHARRGDLVMFSGAVGVCLGAVAEFVGEERLAAALGEVHREGLVTVPRGLWTKAWTV